MRKHRRHSASLWGARTTRFRRPPRCRSSTGTSASTALRATFMTIAIRPSHRRGTGEVKHDFLKNERCLFLREGLERDNPLDGLERIRFVGQHFCVGRRRDFVSWSGTADIRLSANNGAAADVARGRRTARSSCRRKVCAPHRCWAPADRMLSAARCYEAIVATEPYRTCRRSHEICFDPSDCC